MKRYLLDVNVLIALVDPAHLQHEAAHAWFAASGCHAFATCPITESGLLRIVGHPKYPGSPGPPSQVMATLTGLRALRGHAFWPDDLSLADAGRVDASKLASHAQVTDSYLLALAVANGGLLATFDQRLTADAVTGGAAALALL